MEDSFIRFSRSVSACRPPELPRKPSGSFAASPRLVRLLTQRTTFLHSLFLPHLLLQDTDATLGEVRRCCTLKLLPRRRQSTVGSPLRAHRPSRGRRADIGAVAIRPRCHLDPFVDVLVLGPIQALAAALTGQLAEEGMRRARDALLLWQPIARLSFLRMRRFTTLCHPDINLSVRTNKKQTL